jgi:hypothetical protein
MRRTAGAEASSPDNVESGRHSGSGAPGWDARSTAPGPERSMDDRRRNGRECVLVEMAWKLPRFSDLELRYHLRWFVGREDCRWRRV